MRARRMWKSRWAPASKVIQVWLEWIFHKECDDEAVLVLCTEPTHLSWLWNSGAAWLSGLLRIIANEAKKVNPENLSDLRVRNRATLAGYTRTKLLSPTVSPFSNTHNRRLDHFSRLNLFLKNSSFLWTTQHKGEEKRIVKNRRAHLEWSMEIIIQLSSVSRSSSLHARS